VLNEAAQMMSSLDVLTALFGYLKQMVNSASSPSLYGKMNIGFQAEQYSMAMVGIDDSRADLTGGQGGLRGS